MEKNQSLTLQLNHINDEKYAIIVGAKGYTSPTLIKKGQMRKFVYHVHDDYELYCFLSGDGVNFGIENNFYKVKPGDVLIVKKGKPHNSIIKGDAPYVRYVINFTELALLDVDGRLSKFLENVNEDCQYFPSIYFREKNWQYYFSRICSTQDFYEKQLYLTILVRELCESAKRLGDVKLGKKDNISEILYYINNNISFPITLEALCEKFFISKAHINRRFSEVFDQTVWQYITEKRLKLAKELLQRGERPTEVATLCGFNDYNAFFKAYKQKYGVAPKEDRKKQR